MSEHKRRSSDHPQEASSAATPDTAADDRESTAAEPNPPRTTLWRWFTAPKFGSAGSGGAELEPGPERD
jgi:hypothetical protein